MKRLFQSVDPKPLTERSSSEKKVIKFKPFINERDSMGRLLSQPKKQSILKISLTPKGTASTKNKKLLTQIFQDSLVENNSTNPTINLPESTVTLDRKSWKTWTFVQMNKEFPVRSSRSSHRKITMSDLQIYAAQKKTLIESPRPSYAAGETIESYRSLSMVLVPKSQAEVKSEAAFKPLNSPKRTLPKLAFPLEKAQSAKTVQTVTVVNPENQEEDFDYEYEKMKVDKMLKSDAFRRKSAVKILEDHSYFRNIKTQDDKRVYVENQQAFHKRIVSMKDKLNTLRSRIGEFM